jgi:hypothetical protein
MNSNFNESIILNGSNSYGFTITLNNYTLTNGPLPLSKQGILELHINEKFDYLMGPTEGFITISNQGEGLENDEFKNDTIGSAGDTLLNGDYYLLRNDGRDTIQIQIAPLDENGDLSLPSDVWLFDYTFVIRDVEDLKSPNNDLKAKRFYFWDANYQLMREYISTFSTAKYSQELNGIDPKIATNEQRQIYTGTAIQKCLIENNIIDYTLDSEFDRGSTKIFYTSPGSASVYDDIEYIMKYHLGQNNNDLCILNYDRATSQLRLQPLSWFFQQAGQTTPGPFQLEHLFLETTAGTEQVKLWNSPMGEDSSSNRTNEINLGESSKIWSYQFADMAGFDSSKLIVTHPTYNYDFKEKKYRLFMKNNNINNFINVFKNQYTKVLCGKNGGGVPLFTMNNTKTKNIGVHIDYTHQTDPIFRSNFGLKQLLYSGVFLNECVNFWLPGSSHRIPGRFYAIDKMQGSSGKFASKFLGQWLGVEVKHIFTPDNNYFNSVTAIKTHAYEDLGLEKDVD